MTAASANKSIELTEFPGLLRLPLKAAAVPFAQTAAGMDTAGFARGLVAGDRFMGFHREQVVVQDTPAADGDSRVEIEAGMVLAKLAITSVAQDDVNHARQVYASDDCTYTLTPTATLVGIVVGVAGTNLAWVLCIPSHLRPTGGPFNGLVALADAAATLTTQQLDKLLTITPTVARILTLPIAADCAGRTFTITNVADFMVTLDGAASETIGGALTCTKLSAAGDTISIMSDGSNWRIVYCSHVSGPTNSVLALVDQAQTLTTAMLDKLLVIDPAAGRTLTLPAAAACINRTFTVTTLAAQVITLDGNASELIAGAATCVLIDAAGDTLTIMSDGTGWHIIGGRIA